MLLYKKLEEHFLQYKIARVTPQKNYVTLKNQLRDQRINFWSFGIAEKMNIHYVCSDENDRMLLDFLLTMCILDIFKSKPVCRVKIKLEFAFRFRSV